MKKLKLFFAALALLVGGANSASAQWTDVTSTYLSNAGFDDCTAESSDVATKTIKDYSSNGWSNVSTGDFTTVAVTAYGGGKKVGDSTTPSTKKDGTTVSGNTLGIIAGWSDDVKIQSADITLPAGVYILIVDHYLPSSTTHYISSSSRFGFVTGSTSYLVASTSFTASTWTTETVLFTLSESTTGKIQVGLKGNNVTGSGSPAVFYDDIKLLKADYPATPIANNTADLYFKNETTGQFLSAGHSWGTHATVDNYGQEITATVSEGIYSLKTQQYNAYLNNLYMDNGTSTPSWLFLETAASSGKYYMTQDGINYLTSNGAGAELVNVTSPTDASIWTIVSKADRKTALSSATVDSPIDATFLLPDPNFGRNNVAYSNWTWTFPDGENKNNAGNNENFVVECYHKQFTFKTTLAAGTAPAGVYGVTAQGFYRQDGEDNDHLPVFYVNSEEQTFPARTGSEGSMAAASESFSAGSYTIDPIYIRIENEDAFEVGAKLADNTNLWCIWDNFQLKYYGDVTVAAVKMKASVDAYNAAMDEAKAFTEESMFADAWTTLQSAITTNTLDLNDPSLTESALTTATANLVAANTAATAAVNVKTIYDNAVDLIGDNTDVDLTSLITNPGFETGNLNGWTSVDGGNVASNNNWSKVGTYYVERWTANGETQNHLSDGTLTHDALVLPAGFYTITAKAQNQEQKNGEAGTGYFLYANDEKVEITGTNDYSISVLLSDKSELVIKFALEGCTGNWISCDDVHLTYVGEDFPAYTKATGKMDPAKSAAQDAAETTFIANKNVTNYNALIAAIADAEASVANYAALKAAIDKAEAVKDANNFVTAAAATAFQSAITTATNGWTDVTFTDAQATAQITTLGTAVSGWHAIAIEGKAGAYIASAWGKTNENWWDAPYINTWSTEGDNDGSGFSVPFFEYFADANQNLPAKTMTATLTGLDNGIYEVALWARVQRRSDADFNGDNSMITMSVNGGDAVSIMSDTEHNVGTGGSVMRLGRYTARGMVTDGTLTLSIDVKLGSNVHWLTWRDITYTKIAPANVSVTIGATGWTTFASSNAVDLSDLDGATAYYASAVEDETVTMTSTEQDAVAAGQGIMLKGTAGATITVPYVLSGTPIEGNMLVGCTSEVTLSNSTENYANIYVLGIKSGTTDVAEFQNVKNYIDNAGGDPRTVVIPAGKAYLNATASNSGRGLRIVIGGEITGIDEAKASIEAVQKDGKFFKNGKLFIFKNGKKYNATGAQIK